MSLPISDRRARDRAASNGGASNGGAASAAGAARDASPDGKPRAPSPRAQRQRERVLLVVMAAAWIAASSTAIIINKQILVDMQFPFPSLVASLGMIGAWLAATAACRVPGLVPRGGREVSARLILTRVAPTGFAMAMAIYTGNSVYLFLSVAFVQMLKALTPVATLAVGCAFGHERPSPRLMAAVGLIAAGVMAASHGEGRFSGVGVAIMLSSVGAEALRLNIMQALMSSSRAPRLHPLEALMYLAPACAAVLLIVAAATELPRAIAAGKLAIPAARPWPFVASAASGFALNAASFAVVSLSSALTLKVLAICKDVGLVVFGTLVLGEAVGRGQAIGYAISVTGVVWYNVIKANEAGARDGGGGAEAGGDDGPKAALLPSAPRAVGAGGAALGALRARLVARLRRLLGAGKEEPPKGERRSGGGDGGGGGSGGDDVAISIGGALARAASGGGGGGGGALRGTSGGGGGGGAAAALPAAAMKRLASIPERSGGAPNAVNGGSGGSGVERPRSPQPS
ncbi:hypothetical protein Rsub_04951 [Raphidocelis subcapitata]|uniref:Sugar phosphate transporter domain-containing protein n=1 Tax=Raphidocelis subcapitata TaxID=307507 RepID=A0A2V0NW46_9CHLO|nr:hypothetical protein Rsub_04951 [Raphidocelis subcapitata]|eukprot:GBF91846.1 hypothetical protein Rsub_04951 [Raphidocelis subcapitata]